MATKMGAKEGILIFHIGRGVQAANLRWHLIDTTSGPRAFLAERISIAIQRGNSASVIVAILATQATEVNVSSEWKTDLGWEVTCGWQTLSNDTLQSVRLYHNGQQFMIYRPEKHGPSKTEVFRAPDHYINIDCAVTSERGQTGRCVLTLEPYQPPSDDSIYTCEVSGERPMFRIGKMDYLLKSLVVPSDAHLEIRASEDPTSPRVTLNCSTEGLPAPTLNWIVGGDKIQADFNRREWNATSKLWQAWSSLSYTRTDPTQTVTCLPEITRNNDTIKGKPAVYNSASLIGFDKLILLTAILNHLR